ncbi:hypothetical protein [Herbiconiux daphne]|uniref:Glycosyltransferase RgtA/B/C/D-like domain-containing protein n=1 Tax=Herbiconiux daphne TaxID=2970914 RepID=A0ABT2H4P6_9MICO|nr:hypothetical protein [Herbiconiux daphne]MCS5734896.1 hypothetical protein [Herbiconiux daphne]
MTRFDTAVDRGVTGAHRRLLGLWRRLDPVVVARVALVLLLVVTALVLWANVRGQWFIYDEFDYLNPPEGASWIGWLITPHNEHTILFTKLWFSLLYNTIGLQGYWLYAAPMIISHLAGGVAVYKLLRLVIPSRAVAVAAVAPVLLMAAGVGTLTWAGQFQYTAATAAGLWVLYCALSPALGDRSRWVWMMALSIVGTFSGSAYIPLGVAAGLAAISLRRYLLGIVTVLIPAVWFVLARVFWTIPSYNSAHSITQVLRDGPEFVYALLNKAVNDSIPVSDSFTTPLLVVSTLGVIAYLAVRNAPVGSSRARRTYLFLLVGLVLSLVITLVGRLSRDVAESASGGYSYFILIAAIPLFVATIARFVSATRLAVAVIVLLLAGWSAINIVGFGEDARGLADWKASNAALLTGAAYLSQQEFPVVADAAPSPGLAPTVTWSELTGMVDAGRIDGEEPSQLTADQVSLNVQWAAVEADADAGTSCSTVPANTTVAVAEGTDLEIAPIDGAATSATLAYPTSDATRSIAVPADGTELESVAGRPATVTAAGTALTLCR